MATRKVLINSTTGKVVNFVAFNPGDPLVAPPGHEFVDGDPPSRDFIYNRGTDSFDADPGAPVKRDFQAEYAAARNDTERIAVIAESLKLT